MNFFIAMQLAVLPPAVYHESSPWSVTSVGEWIDLRVDMLTTDWRDDLRRESARVELDAAFFHLYGLNRHEVDYVMETFPIVKRKDEAAHGEYRTKRLILEAYDKLAA